MTFWQRLLDLLKALFDTQGPAFPPPVPPPPPAAPRAITKDDDFRTLPRITVERLHEVIGAFPMGDDTENIFTATKGDPLPVAQSWMESNYGKSNNAQRTKNPLGLLHDAKWAPGSYMNVGANGVTVPLLAFHSWANAFMEWRRRMDDPNYKNGVYPQGMTLEQFIFTYVGGPRCLSHGECGNSETQESCRRYLNETVNRLNRYYGIDTPVPAQEYTAHMIAGSNTALLLPTGIPFRQHLTTVRPNRTYQKRTGKPVTVQHTTNNPRASAGAADHAQWQFNATPGHPDGAVSVHFYVDDKEVIQTLPFDEMGIHSGDWRNDSGVAVERTTNAGLNVARANDYAIALQAGLLKIMGETALHAMYPHTFNAEGHCPKLGVSWDEFESRVDSALRRLP
jgi:hypothetical protein